MRSLAYPRRTAVDSAVLAFRPQPDASMIDHLLDRHARARRQTADAARDAGRWEEAAAGYRGWLARSPEDFETWVRLGDMLVHLERHDEAERIYAAAFGLRSDDVELLNRWAELRARRHDRGGALDLFRRSAAIDGNETARTAIERLDPPHEPGPEPTAEPAPAPAPPPPAGRVEFVRDNVVHGWLADGGGDDRARIDFVVDGAPVGRGWADAGVRRGDGFEFRTLLGLDRPARVHARRASDGRELEGSPFDAAPPGEDRTTIRRAADARFEIVAEPQPRPGAEWAILVTHSATGALKPHVLPYLRALSAEGISTLLVVATDRPLDVPPEARHLAGGVMIRENGGYDFAAWSHALAVFPELWGAATLYLVNDSVLPTAAAAPIADLFARVRASAADAVALTASFEYRWHAQSYFVALKPRALSSFALQRFFRDVRIAADKDDVIRDYELGLSGEIERAGLTIEILFPSDQPFNPTLRDWRGLVAAGMPFVKVLLLRGAFPDVDIAGWRETLAAAGFDVTLAEALAAPPPDLPGGGDHRLSAHPRATPSADPARLRVAFYGPWNYDNGLGFASRGMIAALRRTGVRLNLHPVPKPFHVHRQLTPPVGIRDFDSDADIAVVHLNPDSWHLLSDEQMRAVERARRRIGYWVWETDVVPDSWWNRYGAVDRIWAPSDYCARLFRAQDGPPVDVVPHVVPLPDRSTNDRAAVLSGLDLDAAARVILYVFDGASYLVRKNPAALVRAFAASGLAARGWTLLLKTKHLHDRVDEGRALVDLVAGEAGVVIVDRSMDAGELRALVAAIDVYASPHASEGFGLTIAEAMAAGKPVAATDFGGSTDILDAETGYPVRWHPWTLEEDFGHYRRGNSWARIDEPALAAALTLAAADVEAGDGSRGARARDRVAERLSPDAVAALVLRSFVALEARRPAPVTIRPRAINLTAGVPVERGSGNDRVRIVPLTPDGAVPSGPTIDPGAEWIAFAPSGTLVSPLIADRLLERAGQRRDAAIFYADDAAVDVARPVEQLRRKPDFDPTLLAAQDYVGAPVFVGGAALAALGGLDPARGTAVLADLMFRASAQGRSIARIPEVLLAYPGPRVSPDPGDYRAMLRAQPQFAGYDVADGAAPGSFALRRRFDAGAEPEVTILIPTRRTPIPGRSTSHIERLLGDLAATDWNAGRLHVIVGDDLPDEPAWTARDWPFRLTRIATPRAPDEGFNYAAKMNRLWRAAASEQIVFLNDDVFGMRPGWLKALQTFALDEGVGGVGARLLFEDGALQHAGLAPHQTCVSHAWIYQHPGRRGYFDWSAVHREWSMVTGAVFATRRSLLELVNGFDESFDLEFNDTDLCLRLRAAGYRIVCTPEAEMMHVEKASRGDALPRGDTIARFLRRWGRWIDQDPAWHPRFDRTHLEPVPLIDQDSWYIA